jgi:microfibrillar-associated protein 1
MSTTATVRKQAPRLPQPASRYWKGKAPKGAADVQSDSDYEGEEEPIDEQADVPLTGAQVIEDDEPEEVVLLPTGQKEVKTMSVSLRDVNISKEGKVIVAGREESGRTVEEGSVCS